MSNLVDTAMKPPLAFRKWRTETWILLTVAAGVLISLTAFGILNLTLGLLPAMAAMTAIVCLTAVSAFIIKLLHRRSNIAVGKSAATLDIPPFAPQCRLSADTKRDDAHNTEREIYKSKSGTVLKI